MNAAGTTKRRSARLSAEGPEENEPPTKRTKVNDVQTTTVSTKEQDGDAFAATKKAAATKKGKALLEWRTGLLRYKDAKSRRMAAQQASPLEVCRALPKHIS